MTYFPRFSRPARRISATAATAACAFAAFMPLASASGQSLADQTRGASAPTPGPLNIIAVNPFLPLFGYFSGEFERSVTSTVSLAVAGSHIKPWDTRYTNLDVKLRLYPSEHGLEGFNIATSLGVARIKDTNANFDCIPDVPCPSREAFGAGAFAVELGYQWLLGPSKVTVVSVGGGAKRYIASESKFLDVKRVIPTLRLTIGYAF